MSGTTRDALSIPQAISSQIDSYIQPPSKSTLALESFHKPFVTLTFATSLDSQLSLAPGVQTALSGPESKAMTHHLRSRHDAILVGAGTAIADNPSLNCRIEGVGGYGGEGLTGQPRPVVVDPNGRWDFTSDSKAIRLAKESRGKGPFIVTCKEPELEKKRILESVGGKFIVTERSLETTTRLHIDWCEILRLLSEEGVKSVMIEGGGFVINDILSWKFAYRLVDSIIVTIAPTWLGRGGVQVCPPRTSDSHLQVARLKDVQWVPLGEDVVLCGRPNLM